MENRALRDLLDSEDIRVLKTENELDGPERFAADGLVTKEQCDKLIQLANVSQVSNIILTLSQNNLSGEDRLPHIGLLSVFHDKRDTKRLLAI